ncbi:MAG: ATP-binding protein [Sphingomonadaceae bacterium]
MHGDLQELLRLPEGQLLARKSARISARDLANLLIGFANADGGTLLLGVEEGAVEGFLQYEGKADTLLPSAIALCNPPIRVRPRWIPCTNRRGLKDRVLAVEIQPGERIHSNTRDEVYLREGNRTRKLDFEERLQLLYDRGEASYELTEVPQAGLEDLDLELLREYAGRLGTNLEPEELLVARGLARRVDGELRLNCAGVLLFVENPAAFLSRPGLRILRYDGISTETGPRMNLVKDTILELPLPTLILEAQRIVSAQLRDFTRLGPKGLFETVPEYPPFAWQEAIVNAVCHRAYSITGSQIEVRLFDDRMEVESPGRLPGLVRLGNLRQAHFSRNPRVARVLTEFGFVRELGEGVDRMIEEMSSFGLEEPRFEERGYSVVVTLRNGAAAREATQTQPRQRAAPPSPQPQQPHVRLNERQKKALEYMKMTGEITTQQYVELNPDIDVRTARRDLAQLVDTGHLISLGSTKSRCYLLRDFEQPKG